jgi:ParB family chromosome partitioning protein
VYLEFKVIRDFRGHAFHLYTGERLNDMVESIRQNGILIPLIIRRISDDPDFEYEMLSGHNRKNAGILAGLEGSLCIVKDGITDDEALMYVVETNLMQRSFSDMLPSERAAALALRYSKMFAQGKRNDIARELQMLSGDLTDDATCGTEFHKLLSRDDLGEKYKLTGRSIANYIRINKLIHALKVRLDNNVFTIKAGVSLSFLPEHEQRLVDAAMASMKNKLSDNMASEIRKMYESNGLDGAALMKIICGTHQAERVSIRLSRQTFSKYFADGTSKAEAEKIIERALALYFTHHEETEGAKNV